MGRISIEEVLSATLALLAESDSSLLDSATAAASPRLR
jgi:hypothetical protein